MFHLSSISHLVSRPRLPKHMKGPGGENVRSKSSGSKSAFSLFFPSFFLFHFLLISLLDVAVPWLLCASYEGSFLVTCPFSPFNLLWKVELCSITKRLSLAIK